jgi:Glycosyltransferase family 87
LASRLNAALVAAAALGVAALLLVPAPRDFDRPGKTGGIRTAATQLRGDGPPVDLVQDYVGARRLVLGGDPYPQITEAAASAGVVWRVPHRSTHPPTAFLLVLPVAWLPWRAASAIWADLMLCALAASFWAFGVRAALAVALAPVAVVWPPVAWSLGQLTPLWLLGLALAWRLRARPTHAGAAIGLAALTKLLPAVTLVPLLAAGRWRALRGFAGVGIAAVTVLLLLRASAVTRYLRVARADGRDQAARGENSSFVWSAAHHLGPAGVVFALALVAVVAGASMRRVRSLRGVDRWSWDAWTWIGVALLPIAWIYSLVPLLPALVRILLRGRPFARPLALATLTIPFFVDPFGLPSGSALALGTAWLGLALLVDGPVFGLGRDERAAVAAS